MVRERLAVGRVRSSIIDHGDAIAADQESWMIYPIALGEGRFIADESTVQAHAGFQIDTGGRYAVVNVIGALSHPDFGTAGIAGSYGALQRVKGRGPALAVPAGSGGGIDIDDGAAVEHNGDRGRDKRTGHGH